VVRGEWCVRYALPLRWLWPRRYSRLTKRKANTLTLSFVLLAWAMATADGEAETQLLAQRRWFEARTAHFHTYSCGPTQEVPNSPRALNSSAPPTRPLAGAEAVASPPIVVMAYPDLASMKAFVPLYQASLAICMRFSNGAATRPYRARVVWRRLAELIFHEYAHLLMRHNNAFWPLWLKEGMAEIYGTFEVTAPARGAHWPSRRLATSTCWHTNLCSVAPVAGRRARFAGIQRAGKPGNFLRPVLAADALSDARRPQG